MKLPYITLKTKIISLLSILLILIISVAAVGIISMQSVGLQLEEITEEDIPLTEIVTKVAINQLEQAIWFERMMRYGEEMNSGLNDLAEDHFYEAIEEFHSHGKVVVDEMNHGEKLGEEMYETSTTSSSLSG